jgi:DNA primase
MLLKLEEALLEADPAAHMNEHLLGQLGIDPWAKLKSLKAVAIHPHLAKETSAELAELSLVEELTRITTESGWRSEVQEAGEAMSGFADEGVTWRLREAAEARHRVSQSLAKSGGDADEEDRESMLAFMDEVLKGASKNNKK